MALPLDGARVSGAANTGRWRSLGTWNPGTSDFFWWCWIWWDSFRTWNDITAFGDSDTVRLTYSEAGAFYFNFRAAGGTQLQSQFPFTAQTNEWYHLMSTYDRNGRARFYVDNVEIGTMDISGEQGDIGSGLAYLEMGYVSLGNWISLGRISQFGYALGLPSPRERRFIYNDDRVRRFGEFQVSLASRVQRLYEYNGASGSLEPDVTGNYDDAVSAFAAADAVQEPVASNLFRAGNGHTVKIDPAKDWAIVLPQRPPNGSEVTIQAKTVDAQPVDLITEDGGTIDDPIWANPPGENARFRLSGGGVTFTYQRGPVTGVWSARDSTSGNPMVWRGAYITGASYPRNSVVRDNEWLMIARVLTSDPPAPQPEGTPHWLLPEAPAWQDLTQVNPIWTGHEYHFVELAKVTGIRAWLPEVGVDVSHIVIIEDIDDPDNPVLLFSQDISATAQVGWATIVIPSVLADPDRRVRATLASSKVLGAPTQWNFLWSHNTGGSPAIGPGEQASNGTQTEVYIHELDDGGVDRSANLDLLKAGDDLRVAETQVTNRWFEYLVAGTPTKAASVYTIPVTLVSSSSSLRSGREVEISATVQSGFLPTPYVQIDDHWVDNDTPALEIKGFVTSTFPPTDPPTDNAHGIDLLVTDYRASQDWELMAFSG